MGDRLGILGAVDFFFIPFQFEKTPAEESDRAIFATNVEISENS